MEHDAAVIVDIGGGVVCGELGSAESRVKSVVASGNGRDGGGWRNTIIGWRNDGGGWGWKNLGGGWGCKNLGVGWGWRNIGEGERR